MRKTCEKRFTNTLKLFYAKNGSKKQLIFEKWQHFENDQKWPQCKGYSPCKILTLGQKIKLLKICEKRLCKHIKVVLCKKRLEKTDNIRKMRAFWKWPHCKGYSPCKILTLGQKIKLSKIYEKRFYKHIKVVLCKKELEKTANIRKMRAFWKWPKMATMQRLYMRVLMGLTVNWQLAKKIVVNWQLAEKLVVNW